MFELPPTHTLLFCSFIIFFYIWLCGLSLIIHVDTLSSNKCLIMYLVKYKLHKNIKEQPCVVIYIILLKWCVVCYYMMMTRHGWMLGYVSGICYTRWAQSIYIYTFCSSLYTTVVWYNTGTLSLYFPIHLYYILTTNNRCSLLCHFW